MTLKYLDAVSSQPRTLAASRQVIGAALRHLDLSPARLGVLALVGMGASYHAAVGATPLLRRAGVRAFPLTSSELLDVPGEPADTYLAISESGRSRETVEALRRRRGRRLGLTGEPASPLAGVVDQVLPLGCGQDSVVYTLGFTATLQALGLLVEHITPAVPRTEWESLPDLLSDTLEESRRLMPGVAEAMAGCAAVDVVASDVGMAAAGEGALLLREAARIPAAHLDTFNYLHGPMEPLDARVGVVAIGDGREVTLARTAAGYGSPVLLVTTRDDLAATPGMHVIRLPAQQGMAVAILQIGALQILAWHLATAHGLAVDGFRHHQRDTKLEPPCATSA